uniref:Beaded filament structural protein 1 n=1 Tax=Oryzias latipes TaxID=8090 RepID=H2LPQ0_ORYLA
MTSQRLLCNIFDAFFVCVKEQEKLLAQRKVPGLQSQLEEYKSALCQLQAQKQRLQNETAMVDQAIKNTQESYDDEIQMYNEKIDSLRKEIEEAEKSLEKFTSESRHLAMYQTSLENELERYKRIIENEDSRLNSAIIGTPITLFTTNYHYTHTPSASTRGKDITQAIQDFTNMKPRQKVHAKKVMRKKELSPKDVIDNSQEGRDEEAGNEETRGVPPEERQEERVKTKEQRPVHTQMSPHDVPDGAQISKAFDTLCNIVRDRMRKYQRPEPIADFYTKGRYVLVTGDGSYQHPRFYTSTPSAGRIFVTIRDGMFPYDPYGYDTPTPPPPQPVIKPRPLSPTAPLDPGEGMDDEKGGDSEGKGKSGQKQPPSKDPNPIPPPSGPNGPAPKSAPRDTMTYEKLEVVESVEKFSNGRKVKGYEETSMIVETTIEKSSKKKH